MSEEGKQSFKFVWRGKTWKHSCTLHSTLEDASENLKNLEPLTKALVLENPVIWTRKMVSMCSTILCCTLEDASVNLKKVGYFRVYSRRRKGKLEKSFYTLLSKTKVKTWKFFSCVPLLVSKTQGQTWAVFVRSTFEDTNENLKKVGCSTLYFRRLKCKLEKIPALYTLLSKTQKQTWQILEPVLNFSSFHLRLRE